MRAPTLTMKRARRLRRALSPPEARLWARLRLRTGDRPAFRRQHPVGPYVLDFYCAAAKLCIEIDGQGHGMGDRPERDERRTAWLNRQGIEVIRFAAAAVLADAGVVADSILSTAMGRVVAAAPSTACGGPPPSFPSVTGEDG